MTVIEKIRARRIKLRHEALSEREPITTTIRAIHALSLLLNSDDGNTEEAAIAAASEGRPAYWTTSSYHNQAAVALAYRANTQGLEASLNDIAKTTPEAHTALYLLNTLIPLNREARSEIERMRQDAMCRRD